MDDDKTPHQLLFGFILPTCPACGPRKRWRDAVRKDIRRLKLPRKLVNVIGTFTTASPPQPASRDRIQCRIRIRKRSFSQSGLSRRKCTQECRKPIADQVSSRQCIDVVVGSVGLAVHKCQNVPPPPPHLLLRCTAISPLQNHHVAPVNSSHYLAARPTAAHAIGAPNQLQGSSCTPATNGSKKSPGDLAKASL